MIRYEDIVGREWGSRIRTSTGAYAYLLKPTLYDYIMLGFRRVTQVIYPKDSALMAMLAGVRHGYRVLESGVGTGFLTAVLANAVGDEGRVYGYEVREEFARIARENLKKAGLLSRVVIKIKDVRDGIDEVGLDAAFLDLPNPWEALPAVKESLKPSSPVLIFQPTVNQVIKVLKALRNHGFVNIRVFENIMRKYQPNPEALRPYTISVVHTGYVIFARFVRG